MVCPVCKNAEMHEEVNKYSSEGAVQEVKTGCLICPKCGYRERCDESQNS